MDHTFVPPSRQQPHRNAQTSTTRTSQWGASQSSYWAQDDSWQNQGWDDWEATSNSSRSSSVRQRAQPSRPKQAPKNQRGKLKGKDKGKGKGNGQKGKGKPAIEPPPWSSSAQQPHAPTLPTSTAPTKAEAKLQEILTVLKKKDDPELQTLAKEADVLNNKTATSKLHKAVTRHGDAKTAVLEARQARSNLHASWRQYLGSAIETWRSFIEDFDKEDTRLEEAITKADQDLTTAQEVLDDAKKAATEEELKDQIETIEDEDEGLDRTTKTSQAMREGLTGMLDGLEQLRARTEDPGEEAVPKRQKVADGFKPTALQPFGGAGR